MAHLEQHIIGLLHSIRVIRSSYDAAANADYAGQHNHRQPYDAATAAEYDYLRNHDQHQQPGLHTEDQESYYPATDTPPRREDLPSDVFGNQQRDNPETSSSHNSVQQDGNQDTATPPEHNDQHPQAQNTDDQLHNNADTTTPSVQDVHIPYAPDTYVPNHDNYYIIRRFINDALRRGRSACRPLPGTYEPNLTPWFSFQAIVDATSTNLGIPVQEVIHYLNNNNSHIRIWYQNDQPFYVAMKRSSRRIQ